jgi:hypothetical protein
MNNLYMIVIFVIILGHTLPQMLLLRYMNTTIKLISININGPLVDSFEHGYQLGLIQWPDLIREEYCAMFDNNFFESARARGNESVSTEEIRKYKQEIHNPQKLLLPIVTGMKSTLEYLSKYVPIVINTSGDIDQTNQWLKK